MLDNTDILYIWSKEDKKYIFKILKLFYVFIIITYCEIYKDIKFFTYVFKQRK